MFSGSMVALVTPFKENFDVDFEAYGRLVDFHIAHGTNAIVPCGCTGEAATLTHEEQKECIQFVIERVAGRLKVIAGTGSNNTREATNLSVFAKDAGADGILLITPYYNKPTVAGQMAHYQAIADAADVPVVLYNVPGRTGTKMMPETIAELNKIENVVAVKEAAGSVDQVSQILGLCDISVLSGDDSLTLPMMAVGATGVISVAANVVPEKMAALCASAAQGDLEAARKVHFELLPLFKACFIETNPMPIKAMLAKMGMIENVLRLPLTSALPATSAELDALLQALKIVA